MVYLLSTNGRVKKVQIKQFYEKQRIYPGQNRTYGHPSLNSNYSLI